MCNQFTRCWAEIDIAALSSNVIELKSFGPEIIAVVKANAYGHDISIVVPALQRYGVTRFSVATVDEAEQLRGLPNMDEAAIYLMAAVLAEDSDRIVKLNLVPFATDTEFVRRLSLSAQNANKTASVHLEVDTGIGRAGVALENLPATFAEWNELQGIAVTGICTHFTAADSEDESDSRQQLSTFESALKTIPSEQLASIDIHAANSPAAIRLPHQIATLFRPGLLLYGIAPSSDFSRNFPFHPVLSLKARVLLVRKLPKGTDISYSRTYRLQNDAVIATIGIGYGDGYPRRLSNIGKVILPDGSLAPIRGRICMDQLCVEVADGCLVVPGDIVTLIGEHRGSEISVTEITNVIDATPHEITTCLTNRVPRVAV